MPVESIAKVPRPVPRDSDRSLIPIEEGHSVGKQHCIRSLGRMKQTNPYWAAATGVPRGKGELQWLELGFRKQPGIGMRDAGCGRSPRGREGSGWPG